MDNDTNDYKCLCKGHKNNLEQLKDFSNDFSPDKFFEQKFSKVAKSKEHKLRKTDSSRTEGQATKSQMYPANQRASAMRRVIKLKARKIQKRGKSCTKSTHLTPSA